MPAPASLALRLQQSGPSADPSSPPNPGPIPQTGFLFNFPFDPMGMRSADKDLKELKNGRLVGAALALSQALPWGKAVDHTRPGAASCSRAWFRAGKGGGTGRLTPLFPLSST